MSGTAEYLLGAGGWASTEILFFSWMEGGRRGEEKGCGEEEESPSLLAAILAGGEGRRAVLGAWARVRVRGFFVLSGAVARTVAGGRGSVRKCIGRE